MNGQTRSKCEPQGGTVRGTVADLVAHAQSNRIDAIIITLPEAAGGRVGDLVDRLSGIAADIYLDAAVAGEVADAVVAGISVVRLSSRPLKGWSAWRKLLFDRVCAAILVLVGLPLFAVIACAIRLETRGPALFRQQREGMNGAPFTMLKFRTMRDEARDAEHVQATRQDRRVTRVGRFLRRTSLDELPQLLNVLGGTMSLVGPRPHLATTRAGDCLLTEIVPYYKSRQRMKPGITGLAQVNGLRGETGTAQQVVDRIAHDLHYIDNWSFRLDMKIIAGTLVREVFSQSGNAY